MDESILLLRALAGGASGEAAWRQWRESTDLDRLSWESMQILPALNGRLAEWLKGDPAAGILLGIVRRAWTEAQIRLNQARAVARELENAGCGPVSLAAGAAVSQRYLATGIVRPVGEIRLLIRRDRLAGAADVLAAAGWRMHGELPHGAALDWVREVCFSRAGLHVYLQWRQLAVSGELASRCETEFLNGTGEHRLLAALCGRSDPDHDVVPWQVDAALDSAQKIDWQHFAGLAACYAPTAFDRLAEMRELGLDVPEVKRPPVVVRPAARPVRFRFARRVYRFVMRRLRFR